MGKVYVGIRKSQTSPDAVARLVKKVYIGVTKTSGEEQYTNKARLVKKAYIGINGIARKIFGDSESATIDYYGTLTEAGVGRTQVSFNEFQNCAIYAGGEKASSGSNRTTDIAEMYSNSLVKSTLPNLQTARSSLSAAKTKDYYLVAGGVSPSRTYANTKDIVEAYSKNYTRSIGAPMSERKYAFSFIGVRGKAFFIGGSNYNTTLTSVNVYDDDTIRTSLTNLSTARYESSVGYINGYLIIVGGYNGTNGLKTCEYYNSNYVHSTSISDIESKAAYRPAITYTDDYVFTFGSASNIVNTYNKNLVRSSVLLSATTAGSGALGTITGDVLFVAGTTIANVFDRTLTRSETTPRPINGGWPVSLSGAIIFSGISYSDKTTYAYTK